jgi:predicted DNA-binding transcriptional regulator AlpA
MFSIAKITSLRARADSGRLITTESARRELGLSQQRFSRLFRASNPHAPKRYRVGRVWCVNANQLADCLEYVNELEAAMGLSELARYLHMTYYTALLAQENGELPPVFGQLRKHDRWRRVDVDAWIATQFDGAKPPTDYGATPRRLRTTRVHA